MRAMLVSFASYQLWLDWRVTGHHLAGLFTDYEPGIHYSQTADAIRCHGHQRNARLQPDQAIHGA